jgi:hypothetical protein
MRPAAYATYHPPLHAAFQAVAQYSSGFRQSAHTGEKWVSDKKRNKTQPLSQRQRVGQYVLALFAFVGVLHQQTTTRAKAHRECRW